MTRVPNRPVEWAQWILAVRTGHGLRMRLAQVPAAYREPVRRLVERELQRRGRQGDAELLHHYPQ